MSRVTAPMSKISRALSSHSHGAAPHNAGAVLMPKYAELLRNQRSSEHSDSSRGLTTTHRPTPQPSIANRPKPLMQTFHSSASSSMMHTSTTHIDAAILPSMIDLAGPSTTDAGPRVPLLADNYAASHGPITSDTPTAMPSIVAANPENVVPGAPMSGVEGIGLDGIELKFLYEDGSQTREEAGSGMIRDIWKGMVEDVFCGPKKAV